MTSHNFQVIHDPALNQNITQIKGHANDIWVAILELLNRLKETAKAPNVFIEQLLIIFRDESEFFSCKLESFQLNHDNLILVARNNTYFVLLGVGFGAAGGCMVGMWLARKIVANPIMKSVACTSFHGHDNVSMTKTNLPHLQTNSDILVRVRAAAISRLDVDISNGYGRTLRRIFQSYHSGNPELPLPLGRSCSGVVENVGKDSKSGLEIGDEVWLASHFYEPGLASQLVVAHESRVARKPVLIGFEGAASLPYEGCMALRALKESKLNENSCVGKRILIQEGCSPVGCIMTQLIKKWGGHVVVTSHQRSAPVANALGKSMV